MGKPHKLFNKFTNRKKRSESDCAVIQEIVDFYQTSPDEPSRKESLKWLFKTMEDKDTTEIARARIAFLLSGITDLLPGKKRSRLEKYQRKVEAKKNARARKPAVSERVDPGKRIEPAERQE